MSLFSIDNVEGLTIEIELPELVDDYTKIIFDKIPISKLKADSFSDRRDFLSGFSKIFPRYEIMGENVRISFFKNKCVLTMGSARGRIIIPDIEKEGLNDIFNKDLLNKISMDLNYLLGIILSTVDKEIVELKIKGTMNLKKENEFFVSFDKLMNQNSLKKLDKNIKMSGLVLKNDVDDFKWTYYLRNVDKILNVTLWFEYIENGTLDLYGSIEYYMVKLNELMLLL